MSDVKKYYYLKLKDDFFESDNMILLESMKDGYLYSNILLKLYLRSLKNNGRLMLNNRIPYNSQMLASVTRHQVGTVEKALEIFENLGLVEKMDSGAIYMLDIQNFIGESSTEADRKREYRARIDRERKDSCPVESPVKSPDKTPPEIRDKRIEIRDKRIENKINKKNVCPELLAPPDPSGILIPLNDGTMYDVPESKINMWEEAYPAVDIRHELRKMAAWSDSNKSRRKTRRGVNAFINNWLSKEQDRGSIYGSGSRQQKVAPAQAPTTKELYGEYLSGRTSTPDDPFK